MGAQEPGRNVTVADIMTKDVATVGLDTTVSQVTEVMTSKNIGCVVVVDGASVAGIVTERDLIRRVLEGGKDAAKTKAADIMTSPPVTVESGTSVYYASDLMRRKGFRRLPIIDSGKLVGIVTQTDLTQAMSRAMIDLVPRTETHLSSAPARLEIETSKSYLVEEKKASRSFTIFVDAVRHGRMGLCICRENPKAVRQLWGLETTPLIWVTDVKTSEPSVDPGDLTALSNVVGEFVKKAKAGVVFIEAFTYIVSRNDYDRVLRTVQHIRDIVSESDSTLILHVDPIVLSERELELLAHETDEILFGAC